MKYNKEPCSGLASYTPHMCFLSLLLLTAHPLRRSLASSGTTSPFELCMASPTLRPSRHRARNFGREPISRVRRSTTCLKRAAVPQRRYTRPADQARYLRRGIVSRARAARIVPVEHFQAFRRSLGGTLRGTRAMRRPIDSPKSTLARP